MSTSRKISVGGGLPVGGVLNDMLSKNTATDGDATWKNSAALAALTVGGSPVWTAANDGAASGMDADTVDGLHASAFSPVVHGHAIADTTGLQAALDAKLPSSSYTAVDVLAKMVTVDGPGSLLDADFLDSQNGAYYLDYANFTGTPPSGLPAGGAKYDILQKNSATSGDAVWGNYAVLNDLYIREYEGAPTDIHISTGADYFSFSGSLSGFIATGMAVHFMESPDDLCWDFSNSIHVAPGNKIYVGTDVVWHQGNDGAASGMDADLLDGQHGAFYLSYANMTGTPPGGVPAGGLEDNVLVKQSSADGDYIWDNRIRVQAVVVSLAESDITNAYMDATATTFSYGGDVVGVPMALTALDSGGLRWRFSHAPYVGTQKIWYEGNDGPGSGLDADTLDTFQAAEFARKSAAETINGAWEFSTEVQFAGDSRVNANGDFIASRASNGATGVVYFGTGAFPAQYLHYNGTYFELSGGTGLTINGALAWNSGNDGAGSTLDADLLDGSQGTAYAWSRHVTEVIGNNDLNYVAQSGMFRFDLPSNAPPGTAYSYLFSAAGTNTGAQIVIDYNTGTMWSRGIYVNTNITPWARQWSSENDGAGSGLDADLLDGQQGSWYQNLANATGNLTVAHLDSGTNANAGRFWRGDGLWANGLGGGAEFYDGRTNISANSEAYALSVAWNFEKRLQGKGYWLGVTDAGDTPGLVFANGPGVGRLVLTDDGRLYGGALHNNATLPTGITAQAVASGTWTPTLGNAVNLSAYTTGVGQWMRVGNVVTCSGYVNVTPTTAGVQTSLSLTTPIPTNMAGNSQVSGAGCDLSGLGEACTVQCVNGVHNLFYLSFKAVSTSAHRMNFSCTYLITS